MLTAGTLGNGKRRGFFGMGQIPSSTSPVIAEIVNAITPITVPPPPETRVSNIVESTGKSILNSVADFVEENKMPVYIGIGVLLFLSLWRKKR